MFGFCLAGAVRTTGWTHQWLQVGERLSVFGGTESVLSDPQKKWCLKVSFRVYLGSVTCLKTQQPPGSKYLRRYGEWRLFMKLWSPVVPSSQGTVAGHRPPPRIHSIPAAEPRETPAPPRLGLGVLCRHGVERAPYHCAWHAVGALTLEVTAVVQEASTKTRKSSFL